jgi:hypothetical protein
LKEQRRSINNKRMMRRARAADARVDAARANQRGADPTANPAGNPTHLAVPLFERWQ